MVGAAATMSEPRSFADALETLDALFGRYVVQPIDSVLFFDVAFFAPDAKVPFIVLWLVLGATFFTLRFGFINLRAFRHGLAVTAGRYDEPGQPGEVSHFQALSSALSATVGLGNIAGVAVAVGTGGPGAVLWMILAGFLGMSSKFTECALGQLYREVDSRGQVSGGPMRYLRRGLADLGRPRLGRGLAGLFAVMCIGGSFGGGNMFQSNQSYAQVAQVLPIFDSAGGSLAYGLIVAALVGVVIIGGIRRIGTVAGYVVPVMCSGYLIAAVYVLIVHAPQVPGAFGEIVQSAFSVEAGVGGLIGVMVTGFRRAAFSNEAGVGSAAIAHSAAATTEPVREGIVALLEPFIDTILVCTMTALVVVVSGAHLEPGDGVLMTSRAFSSAIPWFGPVLAIAVFLFAFSTMISWSYYGERCWAYLFGPQTSMVYRSIFLVFVVLGALLELGHVIEFSDLMILGMAFPNLLGAALLSNRVGRALRDYWGRYRAGALPLRRPSPAHGRSDVDAP
jgi:alanine or glycine:cation symporter, AGCS family